MVVRTTNELADNTSANLPLAWCPRCQWPDVGASAVAREALVDREDSSERSSRQRVHHQQSYQLTESGQVAAAAHWRANLLLLEYQEDVLKLVEDVACKHYDRIFINRQKLDGDIRNTKTRRKR